MAVAIYGGSFNPPHVAHVLAVQYVLSVAEVSRVIIVPVFEHAFSKELIAFADRVRMCEAAFAYDSRVEISEIEKELPRPSYTVNTLKALSERLGGQQLRLVVGADVVGETEHWHRFEEICQLAPPLVLGRAGVAEPAAPPPILPEISSSQIRDWCRSPGEISDSSLRRFVPARVLELIRERGLYS